MPNGSYQGAQTTTSAERISAGTASRSTAPRNRTRRRHRSRGGQRPQPARPRGRRRAVRRRPAGDDQLGVRHRGSAADDVVDALARHQAADLSTGAGRCAAAAARPGRTAGVDAARHDRHPAAARPCGRSSNSLVGAGRDHAVGAAGERRARRDAGLPGSCPRALLAALDAPSAWNVCTTGTPSSRSAAAQRGEPGHPEVGVHDVGRLGPPAPREPAAELGHVRQELVLRDGRGRARGDVADRRRRLQRRRVGQVRVVAAGVARSPRAPPRPSARLSAATWTFCPPASTPPRAASGLACSETIAMRTVQLLSMLG